MAWRTPAFWNRKPGLAALTLSPIGAAYGAIAARRMRRQGLRVSKPVICVGNLTAGGAGKTPTVIALARMLRDMGEQPIVVSRGYGGSNVGPVEVEPARQNAGLVGDEPLEIAVHVRCFVARDRAAGAKAAIAGGATVILLDDGLQNPSLEKTLSLAVIDGEVGFGNGYCLPAGPLRAPVAAHKDFVDAVIIIGATENATKDAAALVDDRYAIFSAAFAPPDSAIQELLGRDVLAFAGIGRPEKFFKTLAAAGAIVRERVAFADHHSYADAELRAIAERAAARGWRPVTTVKDAMRIGDRAASIFGGTLVALPVTLTFEDEAGMRALLRRALSP
ncbi:MAG: tetraacyldisaccharide 4'-kinase [Beijerinckiaceae bacterium]